MSFDNGINLEVPEENSKRQADEILKTENRVLVFYREPCFWFSVK